MNAEWHYSQEGRKLGPVTLAQLKDMLETDSLSKNDMVWKSGMADWVPARNVQALFPSGVPVPPPLPHTEQSIQDEPLTAISNTISTIRSQYHKQRIAICIAAAVGMLATFMPWVSVPLVGSMNGTQSAGWLTFFLLLPALVLGLLGNKLKPIRGSKRLVATVPAGLAGLIGVSNVMTFQNKSANADPFTALYASTMRLELGIFLMIAAAFAVCLLAWLLDSRPST